jgi:hypothetical protein
MRLDEEERMADRAAGRTAGRWLDVKLAAEELGISSDAVRKRIARGTLRSAKDDDGSVRVWLDGADEGLDDDQPDDQPQGWTEAGHRLDEIIDAKDEALRDLRDQLEHMRRESERKDAIIMQMAQANATLAARVPELEAASERRDAPETASTNSPNGTSREEERREPRRGWWARFFLGPEREET